MATIREFFQNLLYQVPAIGISDIVDILVVSIIFYSLLRLIRSTSAARVARAILLLLAITLLTDVLNLYTLNWLLNKILEVGAIALIIVFQPELRRVLERFGYVTLVECILETGRTHQIRVHMKHIGHVLFNDERYGGSEIRKGTIYSKYRQFIANCFEICPRQALHAATLGFVHPKTGRRLQFESPLPEDMTALLDKWRRYCGLNSEE